MITVKVTSEKTLDTPDAIAEFLRGNYAESSAKAPFGPGDVVAIADRSGIIPDIGIGDVAVVLFAEAAPSPFTHVRLLHANGAIMSVQVPTANLAKRDAA